MWRAVVNTAMNTQFHNSVGTAWPATQPSAPQQISVPPNAHKLSLTATDWQHVSSARYFCKLSVYPPVAQSAQQMSSHTFHTHSSFLQSPHAAPPPTPTTHITTQLLTSYSEWLSHTMLLHCESAPKPKAAVDSRTYNITILIYYYRLPTVIHQYRIISIIFIVSDSNNDPLL